MSQIAVPTDLVLSVRHLTVDLPPGMERRHAVEDISFDLPAGQILCIIGESGSGKSVTANTIMGLLPPAIQASAGEIHFQGIDILKAGEAQMRELRGRVVSIIFQDPLSALNPLMTVGDQILEVLETHRHGTASSREAKVLALLEEVGLPDPALMRFQYPFRLSGGQRQRVMIAMALALDPDLLIADEPTTALDVTTQAQILDLIRKIQKRKGMSVMFITHDFGVVAEIADRVVVMEKGKLVEQGPAGEVLVHPAHPYTQRWWPPFRACAPAQPRSARMRPWCWRWKSSKRNIGCPAPSSARRAWSRRWTASASSSARARRSASWAKAARASPRSGACF